MSASPSLEHGGAMSSGRHFLSVSADGHDEVTGVLRCGEQTDGVSAAQRGAGRRVVKVGETAKA
jgi:hypothetical protein